MSESDNNSYSSDNAAYGSDDYYQISLEDARRVAYQDYPDYSDDPGPQGQQYYSDQGETETIGVDPQSEDLPYSENGYPSESVQQSSGEGFGGKAKRFFAGLFEKEPDIETGSSRSQHRFLGSVNYISRVVLGFAFISGITALIAIIVIALLWGQYFQMYAAENITTLADTTANRIAQIYEEDNAFSEDVIKTVEQATNASDNLGIRVLNINGDMVYDSIDSLPPETSGQFEPDNATQVAISNIVVNENIIGSVRIWTYGSDTLMSRLDEQFRDNTFRALLLAGIVAVIIASLVGFLFARNLVSPINRIIRTAKLLSIGDYNARTFMQGDDEMSQLGMTLDDMARSIERDRELERRLTSDMAHELRTPLMAIQANVEAMIDGVYEPDEEHLSLVENEVTRISRLVDALLKLSRLENRTQPFKEEIFDLGELVERIVISHEILIVDSGLSIDYHAQRNIKVLGDPDKISQAVTNLLSNAVRYTPEGGSILVDVRKERQVAAIDVSDTGVGLTPEEEQMVFSRFWRADSGRKRESGGLGIGLAVVKEIVDRHHGRVLVKGEKGVGSTFTILLPVYE